MESKFTADEDDKLIELVKQYPFLYKIHNKNNYVSSLRINAWRRIADLMQKSVSDCKTRWRTIRDSFKKTYKRLNSGMPVPKSKYNSEKMKFLAESFFEKHGAIEGGGGGQDVDEVQGVFVYSAAEDKLREVPFKKIKRSISEEELSGFEQKYEIVGGDNQSMINDQIGDEHPVYNFFKSMADVVKDFPPHIIAETRMKVCQIVSEMELRVLNDKK